MNRLINLICIITCATCITSFAQTPTQVYNEPSMFVSATNVLGTINGNNYCYTDTSTFGSYFDNSNQSVSNNLNCSGQTTQIIFDTKRPICLNNLIITSGMGNWINSGNIFYFLIESSNSKYGPWTTVETKNPIYSGFSGLQSNYVWNFGNLTIPKTSQYWRLTFPDPRYGTPGFVINEIMLYETPIITSSNPMPLANGDCTTLTASANGETYLWSTGETTQSITVCNSGTYTCQVTNTSFTGNQDHTASIAVSTLGSQDNWPGPNGEVYAIHRTGNTVYYGGNFSEVGPITGSGAAIDETTATANLSLPRVNGTVIVTIADGLGGWYVGGSFSRIGNYNISNLAHINANNSVDVAFNPAPNNYVSSLVLYGGSLYVGGAFTTIQGITNNYIAKIDKNTGASYLWNALCNNTVTTIQLYMDKIIVGGYFTSIGGFTRNYLAALDSNYVQATTWNPAPNAPVYKVLVNGSKLYVGGDFTNISAVNKGRGAGYSLPAFAIDGYDFGANNSIIDFAFNNNVLYAAGSFTLIGGGNRSYVAGLNYLNMISTNFNANADGIVSALTVLNGNLYVGGAFSNIGGAARNRIASLNVTTGLANAWNPKVGGLKGSTYNVACLATSGNQIYAGGNFWSIGSSARNNVAAIDATTGSLLPFDVNANNIVRSLVSNNASVFIGGDFTTVNGSILKNRIAQVNATTGVATGWNPNSDGSIHSLALNGSNLFVGGAFANIGGVARSKFAILSATTGAASSFNPAPNGNVYAISASGDSLALGGAFTTIGGQTRNRVALYSLASGTLMSADVNANDTVNALCLSGSKLYVGGKFTKIGTKVLYGLTEFDLTTNTATNLASTLGNLGRAYTVSKIDSTVYVGGGVYYPNSGQQINYAATIKTQSNILGYWQPQPDNIVRAIYVSNDKVYLGGRFKMIQSRYQPYFASADLYNSGSAPNISSISDTTICSGTTFNVTGNGYSGISAVKIGNTSVTYTVLNANTISVTPNTSCYGKVKITNALGTIESINNVNVTAAPNATISANGPLSFCTGGTVQLSATQGSGLSYQWKNNGANINGANTINYSATQAGNYVVVITNNIGCSATSAISTVSVNQLPNVSGGSDQTICNGQSAILNGSGATTYSWNNGITDGMPFITNQTITFTVTGTNADGCSNTAQVTVTVNQSPNVGAGSNQTICAGQSVTLIGTGAANYTWNNGVVNAVSFNPTQTNTYTVTGTNANGCSNTAQVTINVNQAPNVNAGSNQTVCAGQSVTLIGTGAANYTWNNGVVNAVSFNPTQTNTYTVIGTNANGCSNTAQVTINVNQSPTVSAGTNQTICAGQTVTLIGTGAVNYSWDNGINNGVSFIPSQTNTYTVTGTAANGCSNTAQVTVSVNQSPTVSAGTNQTICAGQSVTLIGTGAVNYSWNNGINNGVSFIPSQTSTYTVTGTAANGCSNSAQVTISVNQSPTVGAGTNQTICTGQSVTLTGTGAVSYSWNNGVSNGVSFNPTQTTTYTVTGTNANGCSNAAQVTINVNQAPNVSAGANQTICAGQSVTLTGTGALNYSWNNGVSNGVPFNPTQTATYTVTGTNANGCSNTAQVSINVNQASNAGGGPNQMICAGQSVTLTGIGALNYSWNNGVSNGVPFNPTQTTTYTVTGTNANGCTNNSQVTVIVIATSTNNISVNICNGESYTIGLNSYSASGLYVDTLYNYLGCDSIVTLNLSVSQGPGAQTIIGNQSVIPLQSYNYTVSSVNNITYSWFISGGAIVSGQGTNSISVIFGQTPPYSIGLFEANQFGCGDTSLLSISPSNTVSLINVINDSFKLYPNPISDFFHIDFITEGKRKIQIYSSLGNIIKEYNVTNKNNYLELGSGISDGEYLIKIYEENNIPIIKRITKLSNR